MTPKVYIIILFEYPSLYNAKVRMTQLDGLN